MAKTSMRAKGGQPIFAGKANLRNRSAVQGRVDSSMAATLDKVESQQVEEIIGLMERNGSANDRTEIRRLAMAPGSSVAQRRAALTLIARTRDIDGARTARAAFATSTDPALSTMWNKGVVFERLLGSVS